MSTARKPEHRIAAAVLAVFLAYWFLEDLLGSIPGYLELFERFEYYVPRSLRSVAELTLVVGTVCAIHRKAPLSAARELGMRPPVLAAAAFGLAATAPMGLTFAMTHPFSPDPLPEILYLALLSPFAEEVVFRGFVFGQLWLRAGWGRWPALAISSVAFGLGHAEAASSWTEGLGLLALTGLGAAIFAWVYSRWGSLVAPISLHVLMNLSWGLWQVGEGALAGWGPFALQLTTVVLAIGLTLLSSRHGWLRPAAES